jgi:hypothetical protein
MVDLDRVVVELAIQLWPKSGGYLDLVDRPRRHGTKGREESKVGNVTVTSRDRAVS